VNPSLETLALVWERLGIDFAIEVRAGELTVTRSMPWRREPDAAP
jgi:hypothetical protein